MLTAGQKMVRVDDGMQGVVELTAMPGFDQYEELRIVYQDRGEKRIAGKREKWEPEAPPPATLLHVEMEHVARAADRALRCLDLHEPAKWWEWAWDPAEAALVHDPELVKLIVDYLQKRA
jgi:hypothetical protein